MTQLTDTFADFSDEQIDPATARRRAQIASIRAFADWAEAHPTASVELADGQVMVWQKEAATMAETARVLGGRWTKRTTDYYFYLESEVVPGVIYKLYADRHVVCERVVVGQEEVEVADQDALAAVPKVKKMQDKVEWRCPDSLLAMTEQEADAEAA